MIGTAQADIENDLIFRSGAQQVWLALLTAAPDPGDDGSNLPETTYTGYDRVQVPVGDWEDSVDRVTTNAASILFPASSGGTSGTITHVAILNGNTKSATDVFQIDGTVVTPFSVASGEQPRLGVGTITFRRD